MPGREAIELFKKVGGEEHLLKTKGDNLIGEVWYRYYVLFHNNSLKIYRQIGKIRNLELLFEVEDDGVGRGTVGIATNGDARQVYFDGL